MRSFHHHTEVVVAIRSIKAADTKIGEQIEIIRKHIKTTDRKAATAILLPCVAEAYRVGTKVSESNKNAGAVTFDSTSDGYEAARSMLMRILRALLGKGNVSHKSARVFTRRQLTAARELVALCGGLTAAREALAAIAK